MNSESTNAAPTSEADALRRETDEAKAAVAGALDGLRDDLSAATDVRQWIRRHPWAAIGLAALGGFAAARDVGRSTCTPAATSKAEPAQPKAAATTEMQDGPQGSTYSVVMKWLLRPLWEIAQLWAERVLAQLAREILDRAGRPPAPSQGAEPQASAGNRDS